MSSREFVARLRTGPSPLPLSPPSDLHSMPSWQARFFDKLIIALVRRRSCDPERLKSERVEFSDRRTGIRPVERSASKSAAQTERCLANGSFPMARRAKRHSVFSRRRICLVLAAHASANHRGARPRHGYRVLALDYRLAPEHRFPMAFTQSLAAYHWLLMHGTKPTSIVLAGDSAGGGLTLALLAALREREPRSLPSCAVAFSPWTDLACTGASLTENDGRCAMFHTENIAEFAAAYLDGASPRDPRASPLYADLSGLPPVLLHVSSTELLLDDAQRMHDGIQAPAATAPFGSLTPCHMGGSSSTGWSRRLARRSPKRRASSARSARARLLLRLPRRRIALEDVAVELDVLLEIPGTSSSGKIAVTGHSGSHAPQSMHSSGWMNSWSGPS